MFLSKYSEKSFVVTGNTKDHKEELKDMGGKWNSKLSCGSGWIFSLTRKEEVETWILKKQPSVVWGTAPPVPATAVIQQSVTQKEEEREGGNDLESVFNSFVTFIKPFYTDSKKLRDILNDFVLHQKPTPNEEVDFYFSNDNTRLYNQFYSFVNSHPAIKHATFQSINKNKFIEHALIKLL